MAHKKFHFDFNEDAEPVEELHRRRMAMAEHFKTLDAIMEYLRTVPTAEEILASLDAGDKAKKSAAKPAKRRNAQKVQSTGTSRVRRKSAKCPVHA